jgi:hypothetical protein
MSGEFQNNRSFLFLDWVLHLSGNSRRKKARQKERFLFYFHHRSRKKICLVRAQITNPHTHKSWPEIWPTLSSQTVVQYGRRAYFQTLLNVDCHCLDACFWFLPSLTILIVTAWCDVFCIITGILRASVFLQFLPLLFVLFFLFFCVFKKKIVYGSICVGVLLCKWPPPTWSTKVFFMIHFFLLS